VFITSGRCWAFPSGRITAWWMNGVNWAWFIFLFWSLNRKRNTSRGFWEDSSSISYWSFWW
jgi:hypothetical protein